MLKLLTSLESKFQKRSFLWNTTKIFLRYPFGRVFFESKPQFPKCSLQLCSFQIENNHFMVQKLWFFIENDYFRFRKLWFWIENDYFIFQTIVIFVRKWRSNSAIWLKIENLLLEMVVFLIIVWIFYINGDFVPKMTQNDHLCYLVRVC